MPPKTRTKLRDRKDYGGAARRAARRAQIRDQARANYGRNLGRTKFKPIKRRAPSNRWDRQLGSKIGDIFTGATSDAKKMGSNIKDAIFPVFQKAMQGIGSLGDNWKRSKQNREILGDVYTDDLRKSMMTDDDLKFYNKYMKLGDMRSGQEAQYYYDEANKALQNAQITNRINYALGQPGFGFETTAPAGVANIDYSTLADRMIYGTDDSVGLAGTAAGKEFLADAYEAQANESGDSMLGNALKNYGQRDVLLDMNVPATDKFLEQFDIAEGLSPMEKYLLQSKAQGKGGYAPDYEQAMIDAGFDMDYIGPRPRMRIDRTAPYLSGGTPTTSEMEMDEMTKFANAPKGSFFTDEEGDRYISTGTGAGLSFDPGAQSFWEDEMGALQLEPKLEYPWSRSSRYAPIYKGLQSFYQYP